MTRSQIYQNPRNARAVAATHNESRMSPRANVPPIHRNATRNDSDYTDSSSNSENEYDDLFELEKTESVTSADDDDEEEEMPLPDLHDDWLLELEDTRFDWGLTAHLNNAVEEFPYDIDFDDEEEAYHGDSEGEDEMQVFLDRSRRIFGNDADGALPPIEDDLDSDAISELDEVLSHSATIERTASQSMQSTPGLEASSSPSQSHTSDESIDFSQPFSNNSGEGTSSGTSISPLTTARSRKRRREDAEDNNQDPDSRNRNRKSARILTGMNDLEPEPAQSFMEDEYVERDRALLSIRQKLIENRERLLRRWRW